MVIKVKILLKEEKCSDGNLAEREKILSFSKISVFPIFFVF